MSLTAPDAKRPPMTDPPTALVTTDPSPLPVFGAQQMSQAWDDYRKLQQVLDQKNPDGLMTIRGKSFRKKSYWRAVAVAFKLDVNCTSEKREALPNGFVWLATYRATAPNGRFADGDGACSSEEKGRGDMRATEHNVRSHAHTRAFNRAVSNLVGFGEVSAEEVEHDEPIEATVVRTTTRPAAPSVVAAEAPEMPFDGPEDPEAYYITKVEPKTAKNGKSTYWTLTFNRAITDDGWKLANVAPQLPDVAALAVDAAKHHWPVIADVVKDGKFTNVIALEVVRG